MIGWCKVRSGLVLARRGRTEDEADEGKREDNSFVRRLWFSGLDPGPECWSCGGLLCSPAGGLRNEREKVKER